MTKFSLFGEEFAWLTVLNYLYIILWSYTIAAPEMFSMYSQKIFKYVDREFCPKSHFSDSNCMGS